jgi:hypothetical protein
MKNRKTKTIMEGQLTSKPVPRYMKWLVILVLILLWGIGLSAHSVSVSNMMVVNYSKNTVTFTVSWTGVQENLRFWVIVDYQKVSGEETAGGEQLRAGIKGVPAINGVGVIETVDAKNGFWLNTDGNITNSTTITAQLDIDAEVDNIHWCAYALDYPPVAETLDDGSYKLYGTPPFTVNGIKLGDAVRTFGPGTCITSLTDATGNPAGILPDAPVVHPSAAERCSAGTVTLSATPSGGVTTAMTCTWIVGGGAPQTTTAGCLSLSVNHSTTYSVKATNASDCPSEVQTGTITIHDLPTLTLAAGNSNQTVEKGTQIIAIKYATANASGATVTGLPDGVSGSWAYNTFTISGSPTSKGAYAYTVTTTNNNGCNNVSASGTIDVCEDGAGFPHRTDWSLAWVSNSPQTVASVSAQSVPLCITTPMRHPEGRLFQHYFLYNHLARLPFRLTRQGLPIAFLYVPTEHRDAPTEHRDAPSAHRDAPSAYRDAPEEYRDAPSAHRDAPTEHRDAPSAYRDAPSAYRDAPEEYRDAPEEHRDAPSAHRDAPTEHRDVPTEHRDVPTEHRDVPTAHRDVPTAHRDVPTEHRDAPTEHRDAPTEHRDVPY